MRGGAQVEPVSIRASLRLSPPSVVPVVGAHPVIHAVLARTNASVTIAAMGVRESGVSDGLGSSGMGWARKSVFAAWDVLGDQVVRSTTSVLLSTGFGWPVVVVFEVRSSAVRAVVCSCVLDDILWRGAMAGGAGV